MAAHKHGDLGPGLRVTRSNRKFKWFIGVAVWRAATHTHTHTHTDVATHPAGQPGGARTAAASHRSQPACQPARQPASLPASLPDPVVDGVPTPQRCGETLRSDTCPSPIIIYPAACPGSGPSQLDHLHHGHLSPLSQASTASIARYSVVRNVETNIDKNVNQ